MASSVKSAKKDTEATRLAKSAAAKAAATARKRTIAKMPPSPAGPLQGFMNFIREQGVIGLAIGLAMGAQVKALVDQIVASFINPMVGLFLPGPGTLAQKTFSLTLNSKTANFTYGSFINVMISFVAVAAVIYFVVKGLKLDKIDRQQTS